MNSSRPLSRRISGALTREAQYRAGTQIAEYVDEGLKGSVVPTSVNGSYISSEDLELLAPYAQVCKLIGSMLSQVKRGELPAVLSVTTAACSQDSIRAT